MKSYLVHSTFPRYEEVKIFRHENEKLFEAIELAEKRLLAKRYSPTATYVRVGNVEYRKISNGERKCNCSSGLNPVISPKGVTHNKWCASRKVMKMKIPASEFKCTCNVFEKTLRKFSHLSHKDYCRAVVPNIRILKSGEPNSRQGNILVYNSPLSTYYTLFYQGDLQKNVEKLIETLEDL